MKSELGVSRFLVIQDTVRTVSREGCEDATWVFLFKDRLNYKHEQRVSSSHPTPRPIFRKSQYLQTPKPQSLVVYVNLWCEEFTPGPWHCQWRTRPCLCRITSLANRHREASGFLKAVQAPWVGLQGLGHREGSWRSHCASGRQRELRLRHILILFSADE